MDMGENATLIFLKLVQSQPSMGLLYNLVKGRYIRFACEMIHVIQSDRLCIYYYVCVYKSHFSGGDTPCIMNLYRPIGLSF